MQEYNDDRPKRKTPIHLLVANIPRLKKEDEAEFLWIETWLLVLFETVEKLKEEKIMSEIFKSFVELFATDITFKLKYTTIEKLYKAYVDP